MKFSIGIYSCPMDPMDSIGTTFYPLIQHERNFSLSLSRIEKCTFPSESIRFQWIRWTPSERLSTPSSNMSGIFLRIHLVGLYTTRLPVFRWKARGYDWILVDSIGQPSGDQLWVNGYRYNFRRPNLKALNPFIHFKS